MDERVKKILVVDDNEAVRSMVRTILESDGYRVDEAASGIEALASLIWTTYDLILSDWQMPDMDGLNLCRWLRKYFPEIPVVIMSGATLKREEVLQAGAVYYLQKPFDGEVICQMVEVVISERETTGRETF